MAGTGYPGPLMHFDSLDPYVATVEEKEAWVGP